MSRILVVEDDPATQRMLRAYLTAHGYDVLVATGGPEALSLLMETEPDLVVIEILLPGMDGLEMCRRLRQWSSVPVLFLTAMDTPRSKIRALDHGGDDYMTKPFHMGEFLARTRALLRRATGDGPATGVLAAGDLTLDPTRREVRHGSAEIPLTRTEFDLLRELLTHAGKVLTYGDLLHAVWGPGDDNIRLVQVHVGNLHRKLQRAASGRRCIRAVHAIGYRFRLDD